LKVPFPTETMLKVEIDKKKKKLNPWVSGYLYKKQIEKEIMKSNIYIYIYIYRMKIKKKNQLKKDKKKLNRDNLS
jgi:regulator of sirC expression with transglutaminase-like and TPR domain